MFSELILFIFCCLSMVRIWCHKKTREPPELSGKLPIVGHSHKILGNSIQFYNTLVQLSQECSEKGGVVCGTFGFRKAYFVTDPEALLIISNSCLEKEYIYDFAKPFVGDGLITCNGSIYKKHRKLLSPAFNQTVLNSFIECFNNQARSLVVSLALKLGKPFNHIAILRQNTLESICLTSTGMNAKEYRRLHPEYLRLIQKIQLVFCERFQQWWFHNNFIFNLSKLKKKQDAILKDIVNLSRLIIQRKKVEMNGMLAKQKSGKFKPFLELLLNISNETKCFTDEEIREETDTIVAAGHETTATTFNLVLILIGSYPKVQDKLLNEIMEVIGLDRDLDKDDLSKLVYTEAVLKETLRLYPVVPIVARYIDKEVNLENHTLKANSACYLSIYGLNRYSAWGPDVNQFRPERWLDSKTLPNMNHFGSFAIGKRNCIGKVYAMMSMKITLVHVMRKYKISADINKIVFKWHMLTYPASGHHYTLERRLL